MNKISKLFAFYHTCEMAVVIGHNSYQPPAHLKRFENELSALPLWLGDDIDFVLVESEIDRDFIDKLEDWGVKSPQFISSNTEIDEAIELQPHPWGWSPLAHKKLLPFFRGKVSHPMVPWHDFHKKLLSRFTGLELAATVCKLLGDDDHIFIPELPKVLTSAESIAAIEADMVSPILLKTPWSASGRGLFKIRSRQENAAQNNWVLGRLRLHGALLAEPFLDKLQDLSFHFWVEDDIDFLGTTFFNTDKAGQFLGCYIEPPSVDFMDAKLMGHIVERAAQLLLHSLKQMRINERYRGPIGIDAMFFKTQSGLVKLHPCIEINLRYTMGLVNLFLKKHIHAESVGYWNIERISSKKWEKRQLENPPRLKDGAWSEGLFMLTPPPKKEGFMAMLNLTLPV